MPFYEYECPHCGYHDEVLQKISDKPLTKCPNCGVQMVTHPYGGPGNVILDTCEHCSLNWVDYGELQRIVRAPDARCCTRKALLLGDRDEAAKDIEIWSNKRYMAHPLPAPGDTFIALAGAQPHRTLAYTIQVLALCTLAVFLGSSALYWAMRLGGRSFLNRYGRYLHLNPQRMERIEGWIIKRGPLAIILGRLIPGLRIPTTVMCGLSNVRYRDFAPSAGNHRGRRYTISAPTVIPSIATEMAAKAKWYHIVTLKMRVSSTS